MLIYLTLLNNWNQSHPHGCVSWNRTIKGGEEDNWESHPHGCVSWNRSCRVWLESRRVTPSRVCELKFQRFNIHLFKLVSHPHGCVSWNNNYLRFVKPTGSHPHGCVSWNGLSRHLHASHEVTPSRVCELKWQRHERLSYVPGHTLTGVWVEISQKRIRDIITNCHTLTGVWVEIIFSSFSAPGCSHTLTGVWVEIFYTACNFNSISSHPHGCVSWNVLILPLTMAW